MSENPFSPPKYVSPREKEEISGTLFVLIMIFTLLIELTLVSIIFYEREKHRENSRREYERMYHPEFKR